MDKMPSEPFEGKQKIATLVSFLPPFDSGHANIANFFMDYSNGRKLLLEGSIHNVIGTLMHRAVLTMGVIAQSNHCFDVAYLNELHLPNESPFSETQIYCETTIRIEQDELNIFPTETRQLGIILIYPAMDRIYAVDLYCEVNHGNKYLSLRGNPLTGTFLAMAINNPELISKVMAEVGDWQLLLDFSKELDDDAIESL